ncbi:MAG: 4'-phosphopantetheinyl transferase superfamily protein [Pseudomonadota bacterium]
MARIRLSPPAAGGALAAPATPLEIWRIDVSDAAAGRFDDASLTLLDELERKRAARYMSRATGQRFVRSHAALRALLGKRAARPAAGLRFHYVDGKPGLIGAGRLRFSLAHCGGVALAAIHEDEFGGVASIGVDVEELRALPSLGRLMAQACHPRERASLGDKPTAQSFLRYWTRKEAAAKAVGLGLRWRPQAIDASELNRTYAADAGWPSCGVETRDVPIEGCAASVATLGAMTVVRVRSFCWSEIEQTACGSEGSGAAHSLRFSA